MDATAFENHPLWAAVEATGDNLAGHPPEDDPNAVGTRVAALVAHLQGFKDGAAALFSPAMLQAAQSNWTNLANTVDQYVNSGNAALLDNANSYADQVLTAITNWPAPVSPPQRKGSASSSFASLTRQMNAQSTSYQKALAAFRTDLSAVTQAKDALAAELATVKTELAAQTSAIRAAATSQNTTFNDAQTKRAEEFTAWLKEHDDQFDTAREAADDALDRQQKAATELLERMRETQSSTEKVASNTTSAVLARDFGSYSNREYWSALGAFLVATVAVGYAGWALFEALISITPETPVSWQWVALKLGVTATILGGASVAIALGHRFLKNSAANKRVELELRAIGPFLLDLDDPTAARKAKIDFVDRTFGHAQDNDGKTDRSDDTVNATALTKIVDTLNSVITNATGKS